jgi:hypothetical protein
MEDYRDEADAAEDLERPPEEPDAEKPEADALEQSADLAPTSDDEAEAAVGDAPEADALEQRRGLGDPDELDDRR